MPYIQRNNVGIKTMGNYSRAIERAVKRKTEKSHTSLIFFTQLFLNIPFFVYSLVYFVYVSCLYRWIMNIICTVGLGFPIYGITINRLIYLGDSVVHVSFCNISGTKFFLSNTYKQNNLFIVLFHFSLTESNVYSTAS